jgi:hypothetical protein
MTAEYLTQRRYGAKKAKRGSKADALIQPAIGRRNLFRRIPSLRTLRLGAYA